MFYKGWILAKGGGGATAGFKFRGAVGSRAFCVVTPDDCRADERHVWCDAVVPIASTGCR